MKKDLFAQKGFTILEIVVVIAIIGILAAVAIPRFMDLSDRAHDASVQGSQTALASAVSMSKAAWMTMGRNIALNDVVFPGGGTAGIDTSGKGWPIGTDKTTGATADNWIQDAEDCVNLWVTLLETNAPTVSDGPGSDYKAVASPQGSTVDASGSCVYEYQLDEESLGSRKITYDSTVGTVSVSGLTEAIKAE